MPTASVRGFGVSLTEARPNRSAYREIRLSGLRIDFLRALVAVQLFEGDITAPFDGTNGNVGHSQDILIMQAMLVVAPLIF